MTQTIEDMFLEEDIDLNFIDAEMVNQSDSDYWGNAFNFIEKNWEKDFDTLSDKQQDWAKRILDDCIEKRIGF